MHNIYIVDDEANVLNALTRALKTADWNIETFTDPYVALQRLGEEKADIVISDYRMPVLNGAQFLAEVMNIDTGIMRIMLSGQADFDGVISAVNDAQIFRFISKPWNLDELKLVIRQALYYREVILDNHRLRQSVKEVEGNNRALQTKLQKIESEFADISNVRRDSAGAVLLID